MNIDKKIEQKKSDLLGVLNGLYDNSGIFQPAKKEQAIQKLIEIGLKHNHAKNLINAFSAMKSDERTAKNTWNMGWDSKNVVDFANDIGKTGDRAAQSEKYFETIHAKYALKIVINEIDPNEISDEILKKISEADIKEDEINNPALRTTFKLYTQLKTTEEEKQRMTGLYLTEREKNIAISVGYEEAKAENESLKGQIQSLKEAFARRLKEISATYEKALAQIRTLQEHLEKKQNQNIFQIIGERIKGLVKQTKQLPELPQLPEKIITPAEAMGIVTYGEEAPVNPIGQDQDIDQLMSRPGPDDLTL